MRIGRLLTLHVLLGMLLLGPVTLKAGSVIYVSPAGLVIALLTVHLGGKWEPIG